MRAGAWHELLVGLIFPVQSEAIVSQWVVLLAPVYQTYLSCDLTAGAAHG